MNQLPDSEVLRGPLHARINKAHSAGRHRYVDFLLDRLYDLDAQKRRLASQCGSRHRAELPSISPAQADRSGT